MQLTTRVCDIYNVTQSIVETEWHTCSLYFVLFCCFSPYLYVCMFFFSLLPLVWWIKIYKYKKFDVDMKTHYNLSYATFYRLFHQVSTQLRLDHVVCRWLFMGEGCWMWFNITNSRLLVMVTFCYDNITADSQRVNNIVVVVVVAIGV